MSKPVTEKKSAGFEDAENVIEVESVSKLFKIQHEKKHTLYENIFSIITRSGKTFEEFHALKNVSFSVKKGEFFGLIGENGSGKSTLLKILAGILQPTSGNVKVNGRIAAFLELGVGFQQELSATENIYLYSSIMGLSRKEVDKRIDKIFEFSGLKKFADTKLKNFSSGMVVRLAFSTAIETDPDVFLVDEVLAVGDMEFQQKCFDKFLEFKKQGKTIILVTHDLGIVRRFCDKVLLLEEGDVIIEGKPDDVLNKYIYDKPLDENISDEIKSKQRKSFGTKDLIIESVSFLNIKKAESTTFKPGETVLINVQFNAFKKIKNPVFGIAIYDEENSLCFGSNTNIQLIDIKEVLGKGKLEITIKNLPFIQGKYYLTIACHSTDAKTVYDWQEKKYSFQVIPVKQDSGKTFIDCDWNISN